MYIISKVKDYYDSVGAQYGIDKSVPFKREKKEITGDKSSFYDPIKKLLGAYGRELDFPDSILLDMAIGNPNSKLLVRKYWYCIGFCGKNYILLRAIIERGLPNVTPYGMFSDKEIFLYSDQYIPYMEEAHKNRPEKKKYSWQEPTNYNNIINNIKAIEAIDYSNIYFENKVPYFLFLIEGYGRTNYNEFNYNPVLNPILKDYQFFKVKNSFTAFQEIQQYISGVIGVDANEPIITDDKYKILAAGFSLRTSFRKDAGKPRPRKQRR